MKRRLFTTLAGTLAICGSAHAQLRTPDRPPAEDNSVEAQLASFEVHEEFEVSLFADESLGIANPIAMQWDHRGRLWVLTTLAYAQLKPGEIPDDRLVILEDSDGDGLPDKSTVFTDSLDMSTGFALRHGGVYLAEGPDLVFLRDTDGDDSADEKRRLLTGFGTGDTHQNISNFVFDSGGFFLYFCQGLHAFSHVETPWGVSRGDRAGFWRFDPRTMKLDPFCFPGMTSANPCGIALDRWGALFIKSNGTHLGYATPGLIPTTHPRELMQFAQVGATPGKSMGVDIVETAHQPDWLQNHAIIAGYFARQITALALVEEGAGFQKVEPLKLMSSSHPSFRPVDIRMGPDGAIYICDWFNPVINHYQVSLRHPHRDYDHGRIWKLTAKNRPLIEPPTMHERPAAELFDLLQSTERWTRDQARRLLTDADPAAFRDDLLAWSESLDASISPDAHALVEVAGILESHGIIPPQLLDRLQASAEPRARAVVARIIARTADPDAIPDAEKRLAALLRDPDPRPRLEAVVACANRPSAASLPLALTTLDIEPDKFIDYSLRQAVHALADLWLPALESDEIAFGQARDLAFALEEHGSELGARHARDLLENAELSDSTRLTCFRILARTGSEIDLRRMLDEPHSDASLLGLLIDTWPARRLKPAAPFGQRLGDLMDSENTAVRIAAIRLAGLWRATELTDRIEALATETATPAVVRVRAIASWAGLRGKAVAPELADLATGKDSTAVIRQAAVEALALADIPAAAAAVIELVSKSGAEDSAESLLPILTPILNKSTGPPALAAVLTETKLESEPARKIAGAMARLGRADAELTRLLNEAQGIATDEADYDADRVAAITAAARSDEADPEAGRKIYLKVELNCVACHQIGKIGGVIGPSLDAVGAGLPLDQIVDSILYPARQLKEGYFATSITTIDGQVHVGYVDNEATDGANVWLRDTATQELRPVSKHQLKERQEIGTLMPPGLVNSLSDAQLRDLIAYLASLQG